MLTKDFTNTSLPLLGENHSIKEVLSLMQKHHLKHLTAYIGGNYGFFSYDTISMLSSNTTLAKIEQLLHQGALSTKDHIWESIRTFNKYEAELLPILDEEGLFCGSVSVRDIFNRLLDVFPIGNGGAIVEIEMSYQNYSLQELGGIVEGANAKINLLSVFPIDGTSKVNVVFSIDKNDATEVIQALERHSYHVNAWFMNKGKIDNILEERYDAIMQYINM